MRTPTLRISKHFSFILLVPVFCMISLICSGQTRPVSSDNPLRSRLDSLVDKSVQRYFQDKKAVGLSIALVQRGKPHFYNYGETRAGNGQRPDKTTIYEIGSMTKSFTGIILAQAILDKKIAPEDDIRKYLKGTFPNLSYKGTPIRIKDLANHTSRITRIFPNMWERPTYDSLNPLSNYSRALLYEGLHQMKMDTLPGKIYSYSNMAVALLGTILEDAYGKDYFSLLTKNILKPYQMRDTRIDIASLPADRVAWPHGAQRQVVPLWDLGEVPAMGALRSTTADLVNYINANNAETNPAIKLSHQRTFGTEQDGMALNWFIHSTPKGYRVLEHGGGTGGSRSSLDCFPQLNAGLVILANSLANRNDLEKALIAVLAE
ncbi:beta-lactamase family protein [Mucilaginibacter sp. 14171R-50]|uniref:serine hydrolase domain-containing protein n=1 Tax=Mucilaginibacter sp. 14171R-50 TaxID=2703789 RepID=UPI00138B67FA|nr:serine hydrolase domain-containing protein [Mucilaginibacter sp. 14171R-50]QHS56466.1 beta-lactamase family protein [Mucilaginibacter sp. 14171R-50]